MSKLVLSVLQQHIFCCFGIMTCSFHGQMVLLVTQETEMNDEVTLDV